MRKKAQRRKTGTSQKHRKHCQRPAAAETGSDSDEYAHRCTLFPAGQSAGTVSVSDKKSVTPMPLWLLQFTVACPERSRQFPISE